MSVEILKIHISKKERKMRPYMHIKDDTMCKNPTKLYKLQYPHKL